MWLGGLDLAAGRGYTALSIALVGEKRILETKIFYSKNLFKIINIINKNNMLLLGIDAPLGATESLRNVERKLREETSTPLLPCSLPGMRMLCLKSRSLKRLVEEAGIPLLLETYPAAAAKRCGLTRKKKRPLRDIIDSLISLSAAISFWYGIGEAFIEDDGMIILPECRIMYQTLGALTDASPVRL